MQNISEESIFDTKYVDFGSIAIDTQAEQYVHVKNISDETLTYRVSLMYVMNNVDRVFNLFLTSSVVKPGDSVEVKIIFKPHNPDQSFTDYYVIDDTDENSYRLTVTGKCFGPDVILSKKKLKFRICKNVSEQRKATINIINRSSVDTTYQWLLPLYGQGNFQISTGICGLIRSNETITATVHFTGTAIGVYTAELVCLVLNQEPMFLTILASVVLPGNTLLNIQGHIFEKSFKLKTRTCHLMENSLSRLNYIPSASVYERYLDFGAGSVSDVTVNVSQTLCVTNHEEEDGFIQWIPDTDNIFIIDPIASIIPPNESRLFTVRFRPKLDNEVYGYVMCGDFQHKIYESEDTDTIKSKHTWFRIPCVGNTWSPCTEWDTEWHCPTEIVLPPTVPTRTSYKNFMLSNKLDTPMYFKLVAPVGTNFVILPMCGIVQSRGWQIITVALEPKCCGEFYETWDLIINKVHKTRICLSGNAEVSQVEVMSQGYNPDTHAMCEFPPTITGCTNYTTAFLHNYTRMFIHIRVLSNVSWFGADDGGSILLPPKEIVRYHWWFFPTIHDKVYDTTVTCSCVCLINGRPVGEPNEIYIHITGFSELPDLKVLPKALNLHDIIVGESMSTEITLYNYGTCFFTSKLFHVISGMGDDYSGDRLEIDSAINSLKPSTHCQVKMTVTPDGAGPRKLSIKYTVLYRTEFNEIEEIQPVTKTICTIWYDGIFPTLKVKRTISVSCPVILSNHCVWHITNVEGFNKALEDCRPNKPLTVDLHAPDLGVGHGVVKLIFVLGCVYRVPVAWSLRREKICDCKMVQKQIGISTYEMIHDCVHRTLAEITPNNGIVTPDQPGVWHLKFLYTSVGKNILCFVLTMPNKRTIYLNLHINVAVNSKGILTALRRPVKHDDCLAVLDCGRVPINNLDPVIRIVWLYNPTSVFTTWRLLKGNTLHRDSAIRCLLYFAEIPPLGKLAIPFAFMPTEMIDYEASYFCSFGYDNVKILVYGQGGLPNCMETRLDIPAYVEKSIRAVNRTDVIYLSMEHLTLPIMPTHSLCRDVVAICNETDSIIRFIWLPERIANIVNIVMTPCWGVVQPRSSEWITMTVYTLQEPATFTTTIACEILDVTARKNYQNNELLRKNKREICNQEFIITEKGEFHPGINDCPPYVLDLEKPQPSYLSMTVCISSKGQRDGYPRMVLKQMWEQPPQYDLHTSELPEDEFLLFKTTTGNNMQMPDIIRVIDGIIWDALHSKMFRHMIEYYSKEEIPTYAQIIKKMGEDSRRQLSRRVTSGICDAIVNKAVFHLYNLNVKHDPAPLIDAE